MRTDRPPGSPPLVLVVDDEADLLELTSRRLRRAGFEVAEAHDGDAGWATLRERRPAVIVLDVRMPGIDGLELTRRMRGDAELSGAGVVLLTASVREHEEFAAREVGADAFVRKPCSATELLSAVRTALDLAASR